MNDLADRVKALLEERARGYASDPTLPRSVATRSRRRRALVGAGAGLGAVAAIVLGAAALGALAPPSETADRPTPNPTPVVDPWRGIWPQATRADGEAAQADADAGDGDAVWQLDVVDVVRRYARQELGFAEVHFDESLDIAEEDAPGPYAIHVISCEPRDAIEWPPVCTEAGDHVYSRVTVERLLRADRTGIWFVTHADAPRGATVAPGALLAPEAPETFVGLQGSQVLLVDSSSGRIVRVLADASVVGAPSEENGTVDLEVAPDGEHVYFVPFEKPERIMRVPTAGGTPELVMEGRQPTISPDGRLLASITCGGELGICGDGLSVSDLQTGQVSSWTVGFSDQWVGQLAWLPDSRTLGFSIFSPGDSNPTFHLLDTVDGVGVELKDLEEVGPNRAGAGWTAIGYHTPTEGFAVRHDCCTTFASDPIEERAVLSVAWNGQVVATLFEGDWLDVELDASGRHFLLLAPDGGVHRLEGTGPVRVADGFDDVDW